MEVNVMWLSPEQPPEDGATRIPDSAEAERQADMQQKQLSLIRYYRQVNAEKDAELEQLRKWLKESRAMLQEVVDDAKTPLTKEDAFLAMADVISRLKGDRAVKKEVWAAVGEYCGLN